MFCHNCGTNVEANAGICPVCGQSLKTSERPFMPTPPPLPPLPFVPPPNPSVQTSKWISEGWAIVQNDLPMFALMAFIVSAVGSAVPIVLQGAMAVGFHIAILRKMRTGKLDIGDCFKGFDFLVPSMVAAFLIAVFVTLGTLACLIPGLVLYAMYQFTYLFILDKRLDFWPAMQASSNLVLKEPMGFTLFALALFGLNVAGALMCVVGLFITMPITVAAVTVAYRDLVGFEPQTATL